MSDTLDQVVDQTMVEHAVPAPSQTPIYRSMTQAELIEKRLERVLGTVERANQYFPDNPYMRAGLYCHAATLEGRDNPKLSPRIITPMIVGKAGYGKTSVLRQLARDLGIGYREIQLGGITDIAEVFGLVEKIVMASGERPKTILALPEWWPDPDTNPEEAEGIIVFDDATRALPHILQAIMQFVINGEYNGLRLPEGWSCQVTANPADGEYNVQELDPAQSSRMLIMGYNRAPETFYQQCEIQDVDDDMKSFWAAHPEQLEVVAVEVPKPDNNDRTKMIWNRIYTYMKHDRVVLKMVGNTMFGSQWVTTFLASLKADQPIDPVSILYNWDGVKEKMQKYVDARRTDLISATVIRLVTWINNRELKDLEDECFSNLAHLGTMLPTSDSHNLIERLCGNGERGTQISMRIKVRSDGTPRTEEHIQAFGKKMREVILSIKTKLGM